jgi:hypothetical protein
MRSSSFQSLIPAAAVAAILAVAPMQFGSPNSFGFTQAQAATTGGTAVANAIAANGGGGVAGLRSTTPHEAIGQGAGNPYEAYEASVTPNPDQDLAGHRVR